MQDLIDMLSKGSRAERSLSQMTLGRLISELEKLPQDDKIEALGEPHSYRGYYSDLAFGKNSAETTVGELLVMLKTECLGKTFTGYKGGEFFMDEHTPLWIARYGSTGLKMMGIENGGYLVTTDD